MSGIVMAAMGVLIGYELIRLPIATLSRGNNDDIPTLILLGILCLVFPVPSVPLFRLDRKREGTDVNDWLQMFAKVSNYPGFVIRESSPQVSQQDSVYFDVNGPIMLPDIITRDYTFFEGGQFCVIKRSGIIGAYFTNLTDILNTKNRAGYCLCVVVSSNHNTCTVTRAPRKRGKHLIEMLAEKHPEIDTVGGRILSGTLEEAQSVSVELIGETKKQGRLEARTGNIVVDSMINHTWKTAMGNDILSHADIVSLPELSIKDADLCVLLGNAFDNALIRILSRKEEGEHGFGLYSMESLGTPNRAMVFADEIAIKSPINCFEGKPPLFPFGKDPALSKTLHTSL